MGGALGLAILSTIASSQTNGELGVSAARALTDGFDLAFTVAAGFALAGRGRRGDEAAVAQAEERDARACWTRAREARRQTAGREAGGGVAAPAP